MNPEIDEAVMSLTKYLPWIAVVTAVATSVGACGGAASSDLFNGPGSTQGDKDSGTQNNDSGSSMDSSLPHEDVIQPPPPDTSVPDTSPPPDVIEIVDMGIDVGPTDPGIFCGNAECAVGQQYCCVSNNAPPPPTYACQNPPPTDCQNAGGVSVECDDAADCPGQVCCGTQQLNQYVYVRCEQQCNATSSVQFCDPASLVGECPVPQTCRASVLLPGYHVCG
jgi:hypothetical protein